MTLSPHVMAEPRAGTAAHLLEEAQLAKGQADPQTLGVLGAGYAILAAAHQMAALAETVEGLAERVKELTDLVASARVPWRRVLAGWPRRGVRAEAGYQAGPAEVPDEIEGQGDGEQLAGVSALPFLAGGTS